MFVAADSLPGDGVNHRHVMFMVDGGGCRRVQLEVSDMGHMLAKIVHQLIVDGLLADNLIVA